MKVFISWSGHKSHQVALVLHKWLPMVIQSVDTYVSSENIDKGARWSNDIATELADSNYGVLCVTKESKDTPWLSFEAGALSKTLDKSYVSPFLFDIKRSEIVDGPILQFQSTIFQKEDIRKLVQSINKARGEGAISESIINRVFELSYPDLETNLNKLKDISTIKPKQEKTKVDKYSSEILEEILELTRTNQKLLKSPETLLPSKYLNEITMSNTPHLPHLEDFKVKKNYLTLEIEHRLNQIQNIMENYKNEVKPVDDELESEVFRLIDFIQKKIIGHNFFS